MAAQIGLELKVMMHQDNMLYLIFFYTFKPQMARSINVSRWQDFEIRLCEYSFLLAALFQQAHACLNSLT